MSFHIIQRRPRRPRIRILRAPLMALSAGLAACQPQQTDILTEVHAPDGTVTRYVNRSNGYGYNPNITGTATGTAFVDTNGNIASPNAFGYGYWQGWGGGWPGAWGTGFGIPWTYATCGFPAAGAASIPQNLNVYGYNPGVSWNGCVRPANPWKPISP